MMFSYSLITFTDFLPSTDIKNNLGWGMIGLVLLNTLTNLILIITNIV
jgi:hypothetical protein